MESKRNRKLADAAEDLARALKAYKPSTKTDRSLSFIALTKAFEVCLEYGWKELKATVEDQGLEANSPKDAVREATAIGLTEEPELWIDAINARNLSVHDYFSMSEEDFVKLVQKFTPEIRALVNQRKA